MPDIEDKLVDDEAFYNTVARWYHSRVHKSQKTWFCESDRKFAEDLLEMLVDTGMAVVLDDRDHSGE